MNIYEYYCTQSITTQPGRYAYLFKDLPDSLVARATLVNCCDTPGVETPGYSPPSLRDEALT